MIFIYFTYHKYYADKIHHSSVIPPCILSASGSQRRLGDNQWSYHLNPNRHNDKLHSKCKVARSDILEG